MVLNLFFVSVIKCHICDNLLWLFFIESFSFTFNHGNPTKGCGPLADEYQNLIFCQHFPSQLNLMLKDFEMK